MSPSHCSPADRTPACKWQGKGTESCVIGSDVDGGVG